MPDTKDKNETAATGDSTKECDPTKCDWKRLIPVKISGGVNANQRCTHCKKERWQA